MSTPGPVDFSFSRVRESVRVAQSWHIAGVTPHPDTLASVAETLRSHAAVLTPYAVRWAEKLELDALSSEECREAIERAGDIAGGQPQKLMSAQDAYWLAGAVSALLAHAVCAQDAGLLGGAPEQGVRADVLPGGAGRVSDDPAGIPAALPDLSGQLRDRTDEITLPWPREPGYFSRRQGVRRRPFLADGGSCDRPRSGA
ncbi:DUF6415 family natural product biosynthesis protein [Streptomyces sp. NPDC056672]|uniref:DUF6415 family natural product biosynthesis protein n=1 Tax=Streptomyces sp. NPDC056672 TaxID=3345906 RepID=UPI0036B5D705